MKQIFQKLCIIIAMLGLSSTLYAYDFEVDGIYYNKLSDGKSVEVTYKNTNYNSYSGSVTIPSQVNYSGTTYSVTEIGNDAFYECSSLKSVTIPNSVTSIGDYAFYVCTNLKSVTVPNSVTSIGNKAFYGTAFYTNQPDGVVYFGRVLYNYKGTMPANTSISIKAGIISISPYAFYSRSGLTSVTIPNSVTEIGDYAFYKCSGLTSVTIPNSVTYIGNAAFFGTPFYNNQPDGVVYLGRVLYTYKGTMPANTSIEIKDGTVSISPDAFPAGSGLTSVTIPNSVTSIGYWAFSDCRGLTSVTIPNSVTSIGSQAFVNCTGLIKSAYPDYLSNPFTHGKAIAYSSDAVIETDGTIYNSTKSILYFVQTNVTEFNMPNSVKTIDEYAFAGCSGLTSVTIGNAVITIGEYAFYGCKGLTSVTIPNSVTYIKSNAFTKCNLAKVIWLPNTPPSGSNNVAAKVHYVSNDQYSFNNQIKYQFLSSIFTVDGTVYVPVSPSERTCDAIDCSYMPEDKEISITDKVINKGVEMTVVEIKPYTYYGNLNIESVAISYNGNIGDYAFSGCSAMTNATLDNQVTAIGEKAFYNCSSLTGIVIPNSVNSLGTSAFENCSTLESAIIGTGVPALPQRVFYGCKSLASLLIPNNVASIGDKAFAGCKSISDFTIEDGENVLTLGSNGSSPLFVDCPLDEVYIGRKLSYSTASGSGYSPFYRNASLRTVEITDAETQIYDNEFYGCTNLQSLKIGDGVTTIGKWAFSGCSAMEYFLVGSNVESIGQEAFSDCTSLTSFTSNATVPPTCGSQALDDINKWECTLYVPAESIEQYKVADQWKDFFFIEESGIEDIVVDADTSDAPVEYYNLQGIRIENPTSGIYIVKRGRSVSKCVIQ